MAAEETSTASDQPEEQEISPVQRKRLQKLFEHAATLTEKEKVDFDYANELLTQCVQNDPGNLVYVEAFLANLQAKYKNNKKGASFSFGGNTSWKKHYGKKDWEGVLKQAPLALKQNPWDVAALRALAEACAFYRYNEVEMRWLKNALDANPKDIDVNRHVARTLGRVGQFDQAIAVWHRVEELKKNDKEAADMISEMTLERNRARAGIPRQTDDKRSGSGARKPPPKKEQAPAKPTAPAATEPEEAPSKEPADENLSPREKLERAIESDASDAAAYRQLAALLLDEGDTMAAEDLLTRAVEVCSNDLKLREMHEDVQIERAREQAEIAKKRAAVDDSEEAQELIRTMQEALNRLELSVYSSRVERYPQEMKHRFELALRMKRAGNYAPAIKYFQEAANDENYDALGNLETGECLQHLKQYERALSHYEKSVKRAAKEQVNCKKLGLYRAAVLAAGLKEFAKAEKYFTILHKADQSYRDVAQRLDKVKAIRHNGESDADQEDTPVD
jgi:tetratricopeptide (TPR) repeat protein